MGTLNIEFLLLGKLDVLICGSLGWLAGCNAVGLIRRDQIIIITKL